MTNKPAYYTWALLALTIAVYALGNPQALVLWPIESAEFHWWQPFTYTLTHGSVLHLSVNMLALLAFGPALEREWGPKKYLACYAISAYVGGVIQVMNVSIPVVGASGSLFGLFAAYAIHNPNAKVISLIPWPLPAWAVLVAYVGVSVAAFAFDWMQSVGHLAHIGGALVGAAWAFANNKTPDV